MDMSVGVNVDGGNEDEIISVCRVLEQRDKLYVLESGGEGLQHVEEEGLLGVRVLDGFDNYLEKEDELCLPRVLSDLGQTLSLELDTRPTLDVVRQPPMCSRDLQHEDQLYIDQKPSVSCVELSPGSLQMEEDSSNQHLSMLSTNGVSLTHMDSPHVDNYNPSAPKDDPKHLDDFDHLCHPPSLERKIVNTLDCSLSSGQESEDVVSQTTLRLRHLQHGEHSQGSQQAEEGSSNQYQAVLREKDDSLVNIGSPNVEPLSPIVGRQHLDFFDHLCHPPSPEKQVVNTLDRHLSEGQESEDVVGQSCLISRDMHDGDLASSLSSEQPSTPCAAQLLGSQQKEDEASSVDSNSQHVDMPLPHSKDCQNIDRPTFSPEKMLENNNSSSSVQRESQYVRKRPTLELQISRHVNKPTSPLRYFQSADQPPSPYQVLQHLSGEAVRVAGEAINSVYSTNPSPNGLGHRKSHSEVVNGYHRRSNSFQRLKSHMQKALRWGSNLRDEGSSPSFNPEILANQKRQWYQLHSRALDYKKFQEPNSLFEHFIITGLHSDANLEAVEEAFVERKKWELEMARTEVLDFKTVQTSGPTVPTLEPQILFKYPPGKKLGLRLKDLSAFCFPDGVKAHILEKTPSLSDLNELVYGQEHLARDDLSFIFSLKSADNATMYGVCLHISEIVQRPPGAVNATSPMSQSFRRLSRYLVSAPRCYCVLTRVPFFELHYEMLNSIIAQERLNRITQFVTEMTLTDLSPSFFRSKTHNWPAKVPDTENSPELMTSAIFVDDAAALTAAAAGIISDDEIPSSVARTCEQESFVCSNTSTETDSNDIENSNSSDDQPSVSSEGHSEGSEQVHKICDNGHYSEIAAISCPRSKTPERLSSSDSLFSPGRGYGTDDDDDDLFPSSEKHNVDELAMEWAKENKIDLLQIVSGYHALPVPARGTEMTFHPLEHLQSIHYYRPRASSLCVCEHYLHLRQPLEAAEVNLKLAAAEEATAFSKWTTATICRILSLDSILDLLTGVLLEKQVVVVCPNLGVLSATVLSLIPMMRPFEWQSLLLPVLPMKMLDFLDAPVPFIAGIQHKPDSLKLRTSNLIHVNLLKDQVKMCQLPSLPRRKEFFRKLEPFHAKLACERVVGRRHPVHKCTEKQSEAADQFLAVMRWYLESLCEDLRSYTLTNVQANNDRVSILLKNSYIESFSGKDQPFIKLFVDTQLFSVLSDFRLSTFEHE